MNLAALHGIEAETERQLAALREAIDDWNARNPGSRIEAPGGIVSERVAAWLLNKNTRTLRKWRDDDRGPRYLRTGRSIDYTLQDLAAHVARRLVEQNPPPAFIAWKAS